MGTVGKLLIMRFWFWYHARRTPAGHGAKRRFAKSVAVCSDLDLEKNYGYRWKADVLLFPKMVLHLPIGKVKWCKLHKMTFIKKGCHLLISWLTEELWVPLKSWRCSLFRNGITRLRTKIGKNLIYTCEGYVGISYVWISYVETSNVVFPSKNKLCIKYPIIE